MDAYKQNKTSVIIILAKHDLNYINIYICRTFGFCLLWKLKTSAFKLCYALHFFGQYVDSFRRNL